MYFSDYTYEEKHALAQQLKKHTEEKAHADFYKLQEKTFAAKDIDLIKPLSPIGLTFIETYVHEELLSTKSKQGISFYDFWCHRDFYMHRDKATTHLIASIQKNKPYLTEMKIAKQVFNLYYGGIHIFRPLNAIRFYRSYPHCHKILDFTMGWGGRLLGACLSPHCTHYTGIDCNLSLLKPYQHMTIFLKKECPSTNIQLLFQDAVTVDYSALDYDMVFTSPPFYNKEIYTHNILFKSKEDWDKHFYEPLFQKTWDGLQGGGIYALVLPVLVYERVAERLLGPAVETIELKKYQRLLPKEKDKTEQKQKNVGQKYKEYVYIWIK